MSSKDLASYIAEEFSSDQQSAVLKNTEVTTLLVEHASKLVGYAPFLKKPIPVESDSNVAIELWRIYLDKSSHDMQATNYCAGVCNKPLLSLREILPV